MTNLFPTVLAASTVKSVGAVIAVISVIGFVWYVAVNVRVAKPEVDSEVELAPNRLTPPDDEVMEGTRLTRNLWAAFLLMFVAALGVPLYWLAEPARQEGAIETFDDVFVTRGARLFAPTAEGGYNCAGCHGEGGVGGVAPRFTLTDADGEYEAGVIWYAPALNTVLLRYSEDEVKEILIYGRPGTPMPAWGAAGGGPLTDQQLDELVAYLGSIQIPYEEAAGRGRGRRCARSWASRRTPRSTTRTRPSVRRCSTSASARAAPPVTPPAPTRALAATRRARRSSPAPRSRPASTSATSAASPTARAPSDPRCATRSCPASSSRCPPWSTS